MAFLLTVERFAGLNGGVAYTAQHRDKNSLREKLGMVALAVAVAAGCVIEREEKGGLKVPTVPMVAVSLVALAVAVWLATSVISETILISPGHG
eukprot:gene27209-26021_t